MRARLPFSTLGVLFLSTTLSASVTGYVVNLDGQPVAGAKVTLYAPEASDAVRMRLLSGKPQRVPLAAVETGATGKFTVETPKDVPPVIDLRVEAKAFAPSAARVERDEDLGAIALSPAEPKRGTITSGGKAVSGATVVWSAGLDDAIATTDAEGHYSVADPSKWASQLLVIHPDFAIDDEQFGPFAQGHPQLDRSLSAGVPVTGKVVGADGQTAIGKATILVGEMPLATTADDGTFTVPHAPARWEAITARGGSLAGTRARTAAGPITIRLSRTASVTGTTSNGRTQAPLPGSEVQLFRAFNMERPELTLADAKGNYRFPALLPGQYTLVLSRPGYTAQPVDLTITAAQQATKNLAAIEDAHVAGSVVDEDKQPVAGAVITANEVARDRMSRLAMRFGTGRREGLSAPDGHFVLHVQPDADVQLAAAKKGSPAAKTVSMRFAPGERKSKILVTIPHGIAMRGRVVDAAGKPLSGVAVALSDSEGGGNAMMFRRFGPTVGRQHQNEIRTGSDGAFFLRVVEGNYDLSFDREGFATKVVRAQQVSATMKPLEVTLEPGVEITGRVVRGGAGVEGVNVFAIGGTGSFPGGVTASDGSFRLSDLSPGALMVNFRKPDAFIQLMRNLKAPARDVVIDLPAGGRVVGRVFDKTTHNAITSFQAGINTNRSAGGRVIMMPPQLRSFTSDDGSFVLENVPPGNTQLIVNAPGYATGHVASLNVEDGKTIADVAVGLETGVRLTGRITGSDGAPISGATVRQGDGSPMMRMSEEGAAVSDANGDYSLDSLEAGEKTFRISAQGYLNESRTVTLSGGDAKLDVQLSSGTKVTGIVVTESETAVADAEVEITGLSPGGRTARTDANGSFHFEAVPPGHYTFFAAKAPYAQAFARDVDISTGAPVRIVMKSGATIYGHVTGLSASELETAQVSAYSANGSASAGVDATGNFRIEGVPAGTVQVQAETRLGIPANVRTGPRKSVEVAAGSVVQVDLAFSNDTTVNGRVTRNGRPLTGAYIDFGPRDGIAQTRARTQSDETGAYSVTGLENGTYRVSVIDPERFTPFTTTYEVKGSGNFNIDIKASPLRGRVTDAATGEPITDARIDLRAAAGTDSIGMRAATTDAGGTFFIDFVPPGSYQATASKSGYGNQVLDVAAGDTAGSTVEFRLSPNPGVVLKVVDGRDGRLLSAIVRATDAQGRIVFDSPNRFIDGDPSTQTLTLAAGQYRVTVSAQGYAAQRLTLISPSQQTVALMPGGSLTIHSRSSSRRRVRLLNATSEPAEPAFTLDVAPGVMTMSNLAPGIYTIQVLDGKDQVATSVSVTITEGGAASADV